MGNPILSQMTQTRLQQMSGPIQQMKRMMNQLQTMSNPQAALQSFMTNNPKSKQVMDLIQKSGGDPQKAFYALAEQQGINPDDVLNMLR